jgi:cytoskeleton protein RodZ
VLQDRKSNLAEGHAMMSSLDDGFRTATAPSAARVGADLRAARERLGWTLPAMAAHLRIRLSFLNAIEGGRTADLPGNAYALGFLRTYAQALGLDADEFARRFRAEAAEANRKTELRFPAPVPERSIPAGAIMLVGALLAVGAYVGWYRMSGDSHPTVQMVQTVPERLAPLAAKTVIAPPPPVSLAQPPADLPMLAAAPPMPSYSPSSAAAAVAPGGFKMAMQPPSASQPGATPSGAALAPSLAVASPGAIPAIDPAAPVGARILLRAKADAWMQVREKGGQVLFNRVLRAGETWQVPAKSSLLLTTGNAAGTEVLVDGVVSAALGGDGAVRRDLPLDADAIKDGKLAAIGQPKRL